MQSSADPDLEIKTGGGGVSKKNLFGLKIRGGPAPSPGSAAATSR